MRNTSQTLTVAQQRQLEAARKADFDRWNNESEQDYNAFLTFAQSPYLSPRSFILDSGFSDPETALQIAREFEWMSRARALRRAQREQQHHNVWMRTQDMIEKMLPGLDAMTEHVVADIESAVKTSDSVLRMKRVDNALTRAERIVKLRESLLKPGGDVSQITVSSTTQIANIQQPAAPPKLSPAWASPHDYSRIIVDDGGVDT